MYDTNSFSMLYTVPNYQPYDEADVYSSYSSSSSSPDSSAVDCTLSLGTPSTRLSEKKRSGFCGWNNILKPKQTHNNNQSTQANKNSRVSGGDAMLARRCASCDTTSTPLWRNGPRGPKSLCNACGIRYKKEERRAAASTTTTVSNGTPIEHQYILNNSWAHQNSAKYPYYTPTNGNHEYSFVDTTNHAEVDNGIPFLSWGLNVADRPSYVHY